MAKDSQINTFTEGMNKDISKINQSSKSYLDMLNFRIASDDNRSNTAVVNIKGNSLSITIPNTSNVLSVIYTGNFTLSAPYSITLNDGTTTEVHSWNPSETTFEGLYESLAFFINNSYTTINVSAHYNANQVVIFSQDSVTITLTGDLISDVDYTVSTVMPAQTDLCIIGYTYIRDYIILFTANNELETPGTGSAPTSGQIWKMDVDNINRTTSLTLIRNSLMNFSKANPIEAVGRYETSTIQKVYWTDNYNNIRYLDVISDSSMLNSIDFFPEVTYNLPVLQSIDIGGGDLDTGIYQFAYRLNKTSGASTQYSLMSNPVSLVSDSEASVYQAYQGSTSGINTTKSLSYKIENIDTNYDTIEIIAAYRDFENNSSTISLILTDSINGIEDYEFTYTGTEENIVDISNEEFLVPSATFTTVKTLEVKDNRLIVGNVKENVFNVDFDSRVYRYPQSNSDPLGTGTMAWADSVDDINPYNKDSTRYASTPASVDQNKYQFNSTTLGGSGTNIDFSFITLDLILDGAPPGEPAIGSQIVNVAKGQGDIVLNGTTYPMGASWLNYKNPYLASAFRGYMRSENYRFGIVFFSKSGLASPVYWIADIRMPEHYEMPAFSVDADVQCLGKALGLNFQVTLDDNIKEQVLGFSIVRVPREDSDKTILGQGLLSDITANDSAFINADRIADITSIVGDLTIYDNRKTFDCPDFKFNGYPLTASGYTIRPIGGLENTQTLAVDPSGGISTTVDHGLWKKFYDASSFYAEDVSGSENLDVDSRDITDFKVVGNGEVTPDLATPTTDYRNYGDVEAASSYREKGAETLYLSTGNFFTPYDRFVIDDPGYATSSGSTSVIPTANSGNGTRKLLCNFYRGLDKQYGGDDENARANNIYISTGHFQIVDKNDGITTYDCDVWGGDTFISVYDEIKGAANVEPSGTSASDNLFDPGTDRARAGFQIFPVESTTNIELRQGEHFASNGTLLNSTSTNPINDRTIDEYSYNRVFSVSNEIRSFFSLPINFITVNEFDNRVFASDVKINGEDFDSWTLFRVNNYLDVDGIHGPINKLINLTDNIYFYQNNAFGVLAINPRSLVQAEDGVTIELGSGGVLHDYNYVSTSIGCKSQWGITRGRHSLYWFDANTKKFYKYTTEGTAPLSDVKGMFSWFDDTLLGQVLLSREEGGDNPILGKGIACTYDFKFNEAIFTFRGAEYIIGIQKNTSYSLGDKVVHQGIFYECILAFSTNSFPPQAPSTDTTHWSPLVNQSGERTFLNSYTLAFNEFTNSFTSFYSFLPYIYVNNRNFIFTPNPNNENDIYLHNYGNYSTFYTNRYDSTINFVVNKHPLNTKAFNNLSWHSESFTNAGVDSKNDTIKTLQFFTDYQQSNLITLDPLITKNIKRKERTWQTIVPRSTTNRERLRDKYMDVYLAYNNLLNNEFKLHYIKTDFLISPR